ncbi:MAG: DUF4368 domain-containing protein [Clostridiales Family XIII bacterium]|nr:DUF4368 domain-containing protein [Clostridiales Family XIII bacterium]
MLANPVQTFAANVTSAGNKVDVINKKYTILYERLSRDDPDTAGDSNSIINQRALLEKYAEQNGLTPFRHLQDDGKSGVLWKREGWQELIAEVEAGKVHAVVVKTLDRIGRDYLRVGLILEQFAELDVRLIAVADGVDTACGEDDFTPFRTILAEWYAKDCSKKIRAIFNSRMAAGFHCSGSIPYGYVHDTENRQKWLVDESAAAVIRRIFQLVIEGKGVYQIANILAADKIPIPSAHATELGLSPQHPDYADPYAWRGGVVSGILERKEYMGVKVLKKTYSDSYKQKKRRETPEEQQITFEGGIPQIVDSETWELAQKLRRTVRRPAKDGRPPSPLTGLLICADCGKKLTHARNFDYAKNRKRDEYVCGNYRQGTKNCTMHYIRTNVVEEIILKVIRQAAQFALLNQAEFAEKIRQASNLRAEAEVKESKKRLIKTNRRCDELDTLIKKLYETYALGKLPENHFDRMIAEYDEEQTALRREVTELQTQIETFAADSVRADRFIELVRRYTEFDELSPSLLNEFVEKVIIHEGDKSSGKRVQKVDVYLNFIGKLDFNEPAMSPEEPEAERKLDEKRAKNAAKQREYRERKKQKTAVA